MMIEARIANGGRSIRHKGAIMPVGAIGTRALAAGCCRSEILKGRLDHTGYSLAVVLLNVVVLCWYFIEDRVHWKWPHRLSVRTGLPPNPRLTIPGCKAYILSLLVLVLKKSALFIEYMRRSCPSRGAFPQGYSLVLQGREGMICGHVKASVEGAIGSFSTESVFRPRSGISSVE
jgi:hypothetical protein